MPIKIRTRIFKQTFKVDNKMKYLSILFLVPFIKNNYRKYREHSYRESSYV
jgi:hypothetical protein